MTHYEKRKPLEVLLVEDNEGDIELTQWTLAKISPACHLSIAYDGIQALEILYKKDTFEDAPTPDIILLDINMPRMDGIQLLTEISTNSSLRCIPSIVLTSSQAKMDIQKAYSNMANCYVVKPFSLNDYREVLTGIIQFWGSHVMFAKYD